MAFIDPAAPAVIMVANVDGSNARQIVKLPAAQSFTRNVWTFQWSPNGLKFSLVAPDTTAAFPGWLYVAPATAPGTLRQLKNLGIGIELAYADRINWSPDSRNIFTWDLGIPANPIPYPFVIRESDSLSTLVTNIQDFAAFGFNAHFDWSPNSKSLSFVFLEKPPYAALPTEVPEATPYIIIAGLDGKQTYIQLPDQNWDPAFGARWSPDGSKFLLLTSDTHQLVVVGLDGTIQSGAIPLSGAPVQARWSPDGSWVAIVEQWSAASGGDVLEAVSSDGADFRVLAYGVSEGTIVWK
jgi:hypothetical protein